MKTKFTNLLPQPRVRAGRRAYFMRLTTVTAVVAAVLCGANAVLQTPIYLYLTNEAATQKQVLKGSSAQLSAQHIPQTNARLQKLNEDVAFLNTLAQAPSASTAVQALLGVVRTGVTISGLTYTAAKHAGAPETMTVTGTAATRTALQHYQQALQAAPFVASVTLPVNAYAKDTDIAFTMTLTGTFTP